MLVHSKDGSVCVTPENNDRFVVQTNQAIEALQRLENQAHFTAQFKLLQQTLAEWGTNHQEHLDHLLLTLGNSRLLLLAVMRKAEYNREFEDEVTKLDLRIARSPDFDLLTLDVLALPSASPNSVSSFVNEKVCLYFDCKTPQS